MPLKIQTYRKVLARLVPHQYAMARSRASGANMIIAWSTICNSFPVLGMSSAWYPATTWTSVRLKNITKNIRINVGVVFLFVGNLPPLL